MPVGTPAWPRALIFDVDGTIADTEGEGHLPAFNDAFQAFGLNWVWDRALYRELLNVTGGQERIRHYWDQLSPEQRPHADPDALIPQLHAVKNERYQALVQNGAVPWRPGVRRLMDEATAAGVALAVATTTSRSNVEGLLAPVFGAGFRDRFAILGCADTAPVKKPAPDVYLRVLEALEMEPQETLAIEDSRNGLEAARAADIPTLITVSEWTDHQTFPEALAVLNHLGDPVEHSRPLEGTQAPPDGLVDLDWLATLRDGVR